MEIPRLNREKLKDIVRSFMAGDIFFSTQVREPEMMGMVFMPILFGAFSYPVMRPEGTQMPAPPVRPTRPKKGVVDTGEEGRKLDAEIAGTQQLMEKMDFRVRWEEVSPEELMGLQESLRNLIRARTELADTIREKVETVDRENLGVYLTDLREYRKARHAWRALVKNWEEGEQGLANRIAAWEAGKKAWDTALSENLGVIYARMSDAGPRSINGYPCFFSCSFLHRLDWELVRKAINKEIERQKDIDLGDDEPTTDNP